MEINRLHLGMAIIAIILLGIYWYLAYLHSENINLIIFSLISLLAIIGIIISLYSAFTKEKNGK